MIHLTMENFDKPEPNAAVKKKWARFRGFAKKLRKLYPKAGYCIVDDKEKVFGIFDEFSGPEGAKDSLDNSKLPSGVSIIRLKDGAELAYRQQTKFY